MFRLALASASLLCLPIAVTLGVFAGLENQKIIDLLHGKVPPPSSTNPDGTPRLGGTSTYCQKSIGIQPAPGRYICESLTAFLLCTSCPVFVKVASFSLSFSPPLSFSGRESPPHRNERRQTPDARRYPLGMA
jgi:hypothetical protein